MAHVAFQKVMKLEDISKFTLVTDRLEIQIEIKQDHIKDFIIKLDKLRKSGNDRMCLPAQKSILKRKAKGSKKKDIKLQWLKVEKPKYK
jgi:hypothetical protein